MKGGNITNEDLAIMVKKGFDHMEEKMATKEDLNNAKESINQLKEGQRDIRMDIEELKEGAFTKDEKEEGLNMVKNIDQQLKDEALGEKNITLTRDEYNNVANTVGFGNRFEGVA